MSHTCINEILIIVSCTGDYQHPYHDYDGNEDYANEEGIEGEITPNEP